MKTLNLPILNSANIFQSGPWMLCLELWMLCLEACDSMYIPCAGEWLRFPAWAALKTAEHVEDCLEYTFWRPQWETAWYITHVGDCALLKIPAWDPQVNSDSTKKLHHRLCSQLPRFVNLGNRLYFWMWGTDSIASVKFLTHIMFGFLSWIRMYGTVAPNSNISLEALK